MLTVMERHFQECKISGPSCGITLQFTQSVLDNTFRATNAHLVADFQDGDNVNYRAHYTTLLDHAPPGTSALQQEGSGCG